jgi:hypothetical protein
MLYMEMVAVCFDGCIEQMIVVHGLKVEFETGGASSQFWRRGYHRDHVRLILDNPNKRRMNWTRKILLLLLYSNWQAFKG